ncbi:MAG: RNA methyltransferase [Myxococcales bacterium 68-20]|nr:RNA methyltransferase [Myxococcales bacterium]OJY17948.1 MAG: RNA methyltransferase [Myxococcales bacterium 68-20]
MAARIVPTGSAEHPGLQPYTAMRERDLIGREGLFVAEGEVVVRVLVSRSRFAVRSLLLEKRRVEAVKDVLAALPEDVPAYVVPQDVMDGVVGFSIHRGVLALGERGQPIAPAKLARGATVLVALVGLTNHDNVGSIFRNAAAFGADGVLLDPSSCDPLYRKAIRVSAGAALVVPFARCASVDEMFEVLANANIEPIALTPRGDETIDSLPPAPRALLLGTEGPGLPEHVLARARRVRIDMAPGLDSLNVAVASGIALHEATRALRRR